MEANKNRFECIDVLKAIGIISIVIVHACNEYNFEVPTYVHFTKNVVYTYHLMIFAVCSGYLFNYKKEVSVKEFILKKLKNYYIKFLFYAYSLLSFKVIFTWIGIYDYGIIDFVKQAAKILFFVNGGGVDGALWFLQMLFIASIIYMMISIAFEKRDVTNSIRFIIGLFIGVVGIILNSRGFIIAYRIDAALIAIPFMEFGYQIRQRNPRLLHSKFNPNLLSRVTLLIGLSIILIGSVCLFGYEVDIAKGKTSPMIWFIGVSMLGILWCISLMYVIIENKVLRKAFLKIGQESATIMAYHFMVFKVCDYVYNMILGSESNLALHPYSYPELRALYVMGGIFIPIIIKVVLETVRNKLWKR